jgi:predicted alpha/beta-hydrolase family hydrolase
MGGRIATQLAAAGGVPDVSGLVLSGYPLHPPGRPDERRDKHLPGIRKPMLIVQGSRDAFGTPAEIEPIARKLSPPATLHVVEGGDHSFKTSRRDSPGQRAVFEEIWKITVEWIRAL